MIPVILSGGSGTRLWPLSRSSYPKQFLPITEDKTLFQLTLDRISNLNQSLINFQNPIIVTNEGHRFIVAEQLRQQQVNAKILLEPVARNTAPAIAAAAELALSYGEDPVLLILAADHIIEDQEAFNKSVEVGLQAAEAGQLVTFGVVPTSPETGYGYIKAQDINTFELEIQTYAIEKFIEKPNLATAQEYIKEGSYLWNSGMFMFKASVYLEELEKYNPAIVENAKASIQYSKNDLDFVRLDKEHFEQSPEDSIDYAVMEHTTKAVVVPLSAHWNDVGAWKSVWEVSNKDINGNVLRGDTIAEGTTNSLVYAEHRLVSVLGLENVVVIETSDAVLVANKNKVQDIKKIVEKLKQSKRPEVDTHRKMYRPWGSYDSIDSGSRYQVKCIVVNPGQKLSLQMHHHRAEHWIVVNGTAKVRKGNETVLLTENQSIYIPLGEIHALENPGKVPLELIEVQSGSYLDEDDIIRFEDVYGRV
ncbi:mannose-1-phosphate guanylyltransferase/mannose-6-phosphate isomerase [Acinetobacter wanghuae]|uniref:mannose-1-phosphate guanylyltransferase n=1 Tax=Acinetobacter wanghuae TaxID=2662362 RepID=A0A5Q0P5T6_9GAMM|nr:mannose-1-phosphate guanylyltransferase/mannose-6-phosphate isomerase [Acinetobacter wanghuae]MQW92627.1 mannose-1-phosphate guanylyltransferase/mannose-6-phosphate isomerase [Acinetobacter wanghuae]QGA12186.1 mannose-1-phosphate guanylyltransferase/mannose-6-phosphate isomerase [Acinetobacter wanghuae]